MLYVKNTFLEAIDSTSKGVRRASSVPPSFKYLSTCVVALVADNASIQENYESRSDDLHNSGGASRTPLRSGAVAFHPRPDIVMASDFKMIFNTVTHHLMTRTKLLKVDLIRNDDGKTTIVGTVHENNVNDGVAALEVAKACMYAAVANTQCTYLIGYGVIPFKPLLDRIGFKARITYVSVDMQQTTCWDTCYKGFCPRKKNCQWCHPNRLNTVTCEVVLDITEDANKDAYASSSCVSISHESMPIPQRSPGQWLTRDQ